MCSEKPVTEIQRVNGVLNVWYFCPRCKAFQFPEYKDLVENIGVCKHCNQKIDYSDYIKSERHNDHK